MDAPRTGDVVLCGGCDGPRQGTPTATTTHDPTRCTTASRHVTTRHSAEVHALTIRHPATRRELLEKYGYLDCVPPGSEDNVRLHRLLLYRRQQSPNTPQYDPLDFRLVAPHTRNLPQQTEYHTSGDHSMERMHRWETLPQEDLQIPSVRQDLLSPLWSSRTSASQKELKGEEGPSVAVWDPDTNQLHYLSVCSDAQIQQAVHKFQALYHVGAGGTLDHDTMELLSSPRCGNPDTLMDEPNSLTEEPSPVLNHPRFARHQSRPRRSTDPEIYKQKTTVEPTQNTDHNDVIQLTFPDSSDSRGPNVPSKAGRISAGTEKSSKETMSDQERMRAVAEELREATRSRHPPVEQHVEGEPHPSEALRRRRRWVEDLMDRIHSGEEDVRFAALTQTLTNTTGQAQGHTRGKRSINSHLGKPFNMDLITWRLVTSGYSSQLGVGAQRASLALAFKMWSEVIPPVFLEDKISSSEAVNISIGFGKRSHLGCVTEFDGLGGELGHTLRPKQDTQIHMDDDEHFTLDSDLGTNLIKVAVHEIGHVLGLEHVVRNYSIMYPVYEKVLPNRGLELGWEDRKLVQQVHGACMGAFDTAFDLLRYNRTRFGDPLYIQPEWQGLPDNLDGYAHVWTRTKDVHLFFIGDSYYVFDPVSGRVAPGYPRHIAQDFHGPPTSKRPLGRTIPSDIDTVYFDKRDENLYFFKGKKGHMFWEMVTFNAHDLLRNNSVVGPFFIHQKWYDICDTEPDSYNAYNIPSSSTRVRD
ncbi:Matrix metalloproteinase-21-like [Homarus americanus]|uniref:Matrix metalloproteinase-21-like n=1 Tax=Homarus americanus TaxID=6706 RepID=A0A8J5MP59_HOMAM|nr:Matrix metalloproteinase-21-like [Homarus americanus]